MNQQGQNFPIPAAPKVPGTVLSTSEAPSETKVHEISVAMLPLQHAQHLENFADNFGAGWFDPKNKQLRLQFQVVVLFSNATIDGFSLSVSGRNEKIALSPKNVASPVVMQRHPQVAHSTKSRFVVDEVAALPDWATNSDRFELMADVVGKPEQIGFINVSNVFKSQDKQNIALAPINDTSQFVRGIFERIKGVNRLFLITVVLPTLIACIYFGFIASDVYISESQFVVRSPVQQTLSPFGSILQGVGISPSDNENYSVLNFILSRDALRGLNDQINIRKAFTNSDVDIFSRFPGFYWDKSFEALYKYYQKFAVDAQMDSTSSIITLDTRAFTAEDSYQMNQHLLEMSEAIVNQLSERARQDMIEFAIQEVTKAQIKDKEAAMALAGMQTKSTTISGKDNSLASKLTEYEHLMLEKDIADKILATAMSSLQDARSQALRQQLYLERIVQPSKPDWPEEPRRLRSVAATLLLGLIIWWILSLTIAAVKEHND